MLVKFSNPGSTYTIECDSVSTEAGENNFSRVKVFRAGHTIHDVLVGTGEKLPYCSDVHVQYYERAYVMENGVTVDTIR